MRNFVWRTLVTLHRYLGIAVGILMLLWFASGIVMMYVDRKSTRLNSSH